MRVVSLVPSVTDILVELGAVDEIVAVSYACSLKSKPVVVKPVINTEDLPPDEIDRRVSEASRRGESLYSLDVERIKSLRPDVVFAQDVCDVCAITSSRVSISLHGIAPVIGVHPKSVDEVLEDILVIGKFVGRLNEARELLGKIKEKIDFVRTRAEGLPKIKSAFLEWLFPLFCSGHWVPELVEIAGGVDIGVKGSHSRRITFDELALFQPSKIIAGPCGYGLDKVMKELTIFVKQPILKTLEAYVRNEIYAVDADTYFSRHGPRIGDAALIIGEIIHPETFRGYAPPDSFKKMVMEKIV
ncbi:MAG: ABC transporter substrate-binding protein [Candidatus Caldarchaeum sp.]